MKNKSKPLTLDQIVYLTMSHKPVDPKVVRKAIALVEKWLAWLNAKPSKPAKLAEKPRFQFRTHAEWTALSVLPDGPGVIALALRDGGIKMQQYLGEKWPHARRIDELVRIQRRYGWRAPRSEAARASEKTPVSGVGCHETRPLSPAELDALADEGRRLLAAKPPKKLG